jgi:P4 family phage/plasmid primase-like protien
MANIDGMKDIIENTNKEREIDDKLYVNFQFQVNSNILDICLKQTTISFFNAKKLINRFKYNEIDNKFIGFFATVLTDIGEFENKKEARTYIKDKNILDIINDKKEVLNYKISNQRLKNAQVKSDIAIMLDNYTVNVELFHKNNPFFYDKSGLFWFWNKNEFKYEIKDDIDMMNYLDEILGLKGQTITSKIKANYIEAFKRVGRKLIPRDAPIKWIQFKDKAYSIASKKFYDVQPNYFFTNPIPYEMGESIDTPIIDKLLTEWVGEKYKDDLYEIIAYCCYRDYPIQTLFCFHGTGRNGKSQFMKLLIKFLGNDNCCSTELDRLANPVNRFESFKLYKKLMCSMGETNFETLNNTSMLKKLVGGDLIDYEVKNKNPFNEYNYAKIIIGSNSLPSSNDTSDGYMRRWHIIDFPNEFPEGKDIISTIPEQEYCNLARKITEILPKLINRGEFSNRGSIEERKYKYISVSNPLCLFIKEYCIVDNNQGTYTAYNKLYQEYIIYLNKNKKRKVSRKEFRSAIEDEGLFITKTSKKIGENWENGYWIEGIRVRDISDFRAESSNSFSYIGNKCTSTALLSQLSQEKVEHLNISYKENDTSILITTIEILGGKNHNIFIQKLYDTIEPKLVDKLLTIAIEKGEVIEPVSGYYRLM